MYREREKTGNFLAHENRERMKFKLSQDRKKVRSFATLCAYALDFFGSRSQFINKIFSLFWSLDPTVCFQLTDSVSSPLLLSHRMYRCFSVVTKQMKKKTFLSNGILNSTVFSLSPFFPVWENKQTCLDWNENQSSGFDLTSFSLKWRWWQINKNRTERCFLRV